MRDTVWNHENLIKVNFDFYFEKMLKDVRSVLTRNKPIETTIITRLKGARWLKNPSLLKRNQLTFMFVCAGALQSGQFVLKWRTSSFSFSSEKHKIYENMLWCNLFYINIMVGPKIIGGYWRTSFWGPFLNI